MLSLPSSSESVSSNSELSSLAFLLPFSVALALPLALALALVLVLVLFFVARLGFLLRGYSVYLVRSFR